MKKLAEAPPAHNLENQNNVRRTVQEKLDDFLRRLVKLETA